MRPLTRLGLRPLAIRKPGSTSSKADTSSEVVELRKGSPAKAPPSGSLPEETQHQGVAEKKKANANKGVAPDVTKPSAIPQDPPKEKEVPSTMEIVLATLPLLVQGDLKRKDLGSSEAALPQTTKGQPKEKIVIKNK